MRRTIQPARTASALILSVLLMASAAAPAVPAEPPPSALDAEPMPPGAPTEDYELTAWCYGALGEYLAIYDVVKPDIIAIDKQFGSTVQEDEPYKEDVAAARIELRQLGRAVTAAEKASPRVIAPQGASALRQGRGIWAQAEQRTHRELARAWLSWALPDKCASTSRTLLAKSNLLGHALASNAGTALDAQSEPAPVAGPEPVAVASAPAPAPAVAEAAPPEPTPSRVIEASGPPPSSAPMPTAAASPPPAAQASVVPPPVVRPAPTPTAAAPQSDQSQEPTL